jgi:NAD(P)-dependent dehydrogenase (short-subunit alcohol dehydrogenase family)
MQDSLIGRTLLVTGANRGIGAALVDEALRRGAGRVYAGTRQPLHHADPRVVAVELDLTDAGQIRAAAQRIERLDMLVNNAGLARYDTLDDPGVIDEHLAVNLFGPQALTRALLPQLEGAGGHVVNVLSIAALASLPMIPAYSISKAAAFSWTQSLRVLMGSRGVAVHAVLTGPVDTDMSRDLDIPKAAPDDVARAILDGVAEGADEIFPDPLSATLAAEWVSGGIKAMQRANAELLAAS